MKHSERLNDMPGTDRRGDPSAAEVHDSALEALATNNLVEVRFLEAGTTTQFGRHGRAWKAA